MDWIGKTSAILNGRVACSFDNTSEDSHPALSRKSIAEELFLYNYTAQTIVLFAAVTYWERIASYSDGIKMALDKKDSNGFILSPNNSDEDVEVYKDITIWIWTICPPITLVFGTTGNILSGLVMSRTSLQATTTSLLFIVLAIMDTIVLWVGLIRQWLMYAYGIEDIRLLSNFSCKLHTFLVYWFSHLASWMLVCIACERCFVVFFPFLAKRIGTKRNAMLFVLAIAIVLFAINVQFLWTVQLAQVTLHTNKTRLGCNEPVEHQYFALIIWPWIDFTLFSLAPFAILAVANLSIVFALIHRNYLRSKRLHKSVTSAQNMKIGNLTFVNFAVSAWFLVTTLPISVFLIMQHVWVLNETWPAQQTEDVTHFVWAISANVSYLNNSFNFVLYIMTSRRFRNELLLLFKGKTNQESRSTMV